VAADRLYVKTANQAAWHFCTNCPQYPYDYGRKTQDHLPKGVYVCPVCRALEAEKKCESEMGTNL
jgi:hypothetical protein